MRNHADAPPGAGRRAADQGPQGAAQPHPAIKIADRGYVIVHGEIEFEGKTAADLANNEIIKQYYLGT
jgi:hypothetical protein